MSDEGLTVRLTLPPRSFPSTAIEKEAGRATPPIPEKRPIPAVTALAVAHLIERALENGDVKTYNEAAARLGISKARMIQRASLLALAPAVQEAVLLGQIDVSVRDLQWLVRTPSWAEQERWTSARDASSANR